MFSTARTVLVSFLLALTLGRVALAQSQWNRSIEAVHVVPVADGSGVLLNVVPYVHIEAGETTVPLDLSSRVMVFVNGAMVESFDLQTTVNPAGGCGISCATFQPCICTTIPSGQTFCFCGGGLVAPDGVDVELQPGDELMILLRPAPGALPEQDQDDDQDIQRYDGQSIGWNRRVDAVELREIPGADGRYDIVARTAIEARYEGHLDLRGELELLVNGQPAGTIPADWDEWEWAACTGGCSDAGCAYDEAGSTVGVCGDIFDGCGCELAITAHTTTFEAIPLDPGETFDVILRPVPGALPELPGFPEDDEEGGTVPCRGDLDGDGFVGFTDLLQILAAWGPCAGCPQDLNGDNAVDFSDLLTVLAAWGPCIDV